MVAADELDPEGRLLEATRAIVGEDVPIVVSLDLHGVLTDRMLRQADAVVSYLTYPHVDMRETGRRAARLLLRILDDGVRPVTARITIPALVRGDELITDTGLFGRFTRRAAELEARRGRAGGRGPHQQPVHRRPRAPDERLRDARRRPGAGGQRCPRPGDRLLGGPRADAAAARVARGGRRAGACHADGTVILTDAADATSSGASGDSNAILRALADGGYEGTVLAPIVDPDAVAASVAAGQGGRLRTTIGGRLDPGRFEPMPFEGQVVALSDGRFASEADGLEWWSGADRGPRRTRR